MTSNWLKGKALVKKFGIIDGELFDYVKSGLQPYNSIGRPVLPPGIKETQIRLEEAKKGYISACIYYHKQHGRSFDFNNVDSDSLDDQTVADVIKNTLPVILQCKDLLKKYPDLPTWKNYELPEDDGEAQEVINVLVKAHYKLDDVIEIRRQRGDCNIDEIMTVKQPAEQTGEQHTVNITGGHEDFIRSLQVSFVDDVTICLQGPDMGVRKVTCKDMGIKEGAKIWLPLLEVLTSSDHTCRISTYDINKDPVKVKLYNAEAKRIQKFSEKFVAFLNKDCSASLPADFSVFENMKNRERAGTYKPKFQIASGIQKSDRLDSLIEMDSDQVLRRIETLIQQIKRERDDDKQVPLLAEVSRYAQHARKMQYINDEQLRSFITLPDKNVFHQDAMSGAEQFDENILPDGDYDLPPDEQFPF